MGTVRFLFGLFLFASFPAAAQTVISGDTIKLNGSVFHLWGVYAPAAGQTCADGWAAGNISKEYLAALIHGRTVKCESKAPAADGSIPAICLMDKQDLGAAAVSAGMAWAFLADGQDYVVQEANAMSSLLGVHAHSCFKARESDQRRQNQP